jgi:cysteine-rich repeat protein
MNRSNLWRASLVMVVALAAACGQELPAEEQASSLASREDEVFSSNKALILAGTVNGGANSPEALAVKKFGYGLEVVTDAQWSAMTAEQFATYRVIILGDKGCGNLNAVAPAVANRAVWGPVVNGNVLIAGTAPTANGATLVTEKAIRFAAYSAGKTGLYVSLSCYYQNAEPDTHVTLLEPFGDFAVQGAGCYDTTHIVANHPVLDTLTDENMSNWPCSVNSSFTSFPMANFAPWSVAMYPAPEAGEMGTMSVGTQEYVDGTFGAPYILARGATLMGCGDGWVQPTEQCDFGVEVNGIPGVECSATCRLNWCGDGIVGEGEDCDPAAAGMAACPRSCRVMSHPPPPPPPANLPPVAVCKHLTLNTPANACGASGSVNNGSYDPEGSAVNCTQSLNAFTLGQQSVTLTCVDAQGLAASCSAYVTVVDASAPEISCPAASTFECGLGAPAVEQNPATATDNCGTPYVSYQLEGDTFSVGAARVVRWSANDGTNEASCSSELTMVDTLAPSLALNGPARLNLECKVDSYTELRASAYDACAGDLSDRLTITGAVDTAAVGSYPVSYRIADPSGHAAEASREVVVADTRAPVLTLNGAASQALECGVGQYAEAGAVASDVCAGNLAVAISGTVNTAAKGNYSVSYRAADASGNAASATRAVSVKDTLAPSISLNGSAALKLECKVDSYTEQNAVASDACSGNLSGAVAISGAVNTAAVGNYAVSYQVTDAVGLSASVTRNVQVADTKAPVLSLNGSNTVALECGLSQYTEAGAVASDVCTGDLSGAVVISGTVNAAARGAYAVSYRVTDASGNAATATRSVSVNDTLAPSIALNGLASLKLECGVDSYTEQSAVASDACSGNLTGAIVKAGSVNAAAVGNYAVSYQVTDGAGLSASVTRAVQVADTKAPVLTLNGSSALSLECGVDSYTEQNAVASDVCGGNLTSAIVKSGSVNTKAPGSYPVSYQVADASGNAASATRAVSVKDTRAPSISLLGAATIKVQVGSTFVDPGATAADVCSGNLGVIKSGTVNTAVAGSYTLTYSATDGAGLSASVTRTVTVEQAPQSCTSVSVKAAQEIWPPNHKMLSFNLSECAVVQNPCGGPVDINTVGTITSIYSDEVEDANGNGDGSTLQDIVITGKSTFQLRAERQGKGNGRVYGVNFKVTDSSGAEQTATCKFVVPHDQSGRGATDDGAAAGYTVFASSQLAGR